MDTTELHMKEALVGGSGVEAVCGIAAVVLPILGLADVIPGIMLAISGIAVGVGLLFEGGAIAAEHKKLVARITETKLQELEVDTGMSVELVGGLAAIVLGILSVLTLAPMVLMSVSAIVVGTALILSSGTTVRMNALRLAASSQESRVQNLARDVVNTSAGTQVFIGVGAVVLGILALIGIASQVLALVAFLCIGSSMALSGSALGSRLMGALK